MFLQLFHIIELQRASQPGDELQVHPLHAVWAGVVLGNAVDGGQAPAQARPRAAIMTEWKGFTMAT